MSPTVHYSPRVLDRHVYAVVNRENHLPVLIFTQELPNLEDPPARRGLRLFTEIWLGHWQEQPSRYPFVRGAEHLEEIVRTGFEVVEVPHGLVLEIQ